MQPLPTAKNRAHKTRLHHRRFGYFARLILNRRPGIPPSPQRIVFPPAKTVTNDARTVVRIFIGSEAGQARSERVLIWSILKHRDPTRAYEIYIVKDLMRFSRRFWKTGFTNYRYAIPHFADVAGRAIYNDADQVCLADPAELFDRPMLGGAALSVDGRDTSVMLLDCAKMAASWPMALARSGKPQHQTFRAIRDTADQRGPLPNAWNVRDDAYQAGETKILHFTTLQTQPWRLLPSEINYSSHPHASVWLVLEADADAVGFSPSIIENSA
jgi:transposase